LVAFTFVPAGQILGRAFEKHPRVIRAYTLNILGSLAGVWMFNGLSLASATPALWFVVVTALLAASLLTANGAHRWAGVAMTAVSAMLVWFGRDESARTIWSPYQKLSLTPFFAEEGTNRVQQGYSLKVNG